MSRVLPILFNTEMVQGILREPPNNKTVTRRAIKGYIPNDAIWGYTEFTPKGYISCRGTFADGYGEKFFKLPCCPDDVLYVRETWNFVYDMDGSDQIVEDTGRYIYYADDPMPFSEWIDTNTGEHKEYMPWRPSIHMPKAAARIWLKVMDVRVERLREITPEDAWKEGARCLCMHPVPDCAGNKTEFIKIWDSTIKKADIDRYGWGTNPWVWVIEFERCEKPESEV